MKELEGKTVLVTGAASGIGRETALAFARHGSRLLLVDIEARPLEELADSLRKGGLDCAAYQVDVSDRGQVWELAERVSAEFGRLDVLVNCAGVFVWADILDTTPEDWEWLMGVNLWGPINTISAFLPGMVDSKNGHIVNVSSSGGLFAMSSVGAYSATKFALVGLSEALRQEVREDNVGVTAVCPGSTRTPIVGRTRVRGYDPEKLERYFYRLFNRMRPERTAKAIVGAVERDRPLVLTTATARLLYFAKRLSPALMLFLMRPVRRLYGLMR